MVSTFDVFSKSEDKTPQTNIELYIILVFFTHKASKWENLVITNMCWQLISTDLSLFHICHTISYASIQVQGNTKHSSIAKELKQRKLQIPKFCDIF